MRDLEQLGPEGTPGYAPGPPWILGHRGSPREAPENTLASLRAALAHGLDGVEYDVHASLEGEPVLIHDETVTRTTDSVGPVADKALSELLQLDAGGWFHKRFAGEPLPLLEEALALGLEQEHAPLQMIELKTAGLVERVDQAVREHGLERSVRIASFDRRVCLAARDAGLATMLLAVEAEQRDLDFVREQGIEAHGVAAHGWRSPAGALEWPCERWAWSVDDPSDLLEACRRPLFGLNTNEPRRALAIRTLVALAPDDAGPYPLEVPRLDLERSDAIPGGAQWAGRWEFEVGVRNPLAWAVEVELGFVGRGGVYDVAGEPSTFTLEAGERRAVALTLAGGSWSPGPDPALMTRLRWGPAPARPAGELILDAPLVRSRTAVLRDAPTRLHCLPESPNAPAASVTVQRNGRALLARIEAAGGLEDAQVEVHIDGVVRLGGRSLRVFLPEDFDQRSGGVPFSVGLVGRVPGGGPPRWAHRRWAGGLPADLLSGEPGRLVPSA
jgi:glycerophosphoryl diester phosphodiesterase